MCHILKIKQSEKKNEINLPSVTFVMKHLKSIIYIKYIETKFKNLVIAPSKYDQHLSRVCNGKERKVNFTAYTNCIRFHFSTHIQFPLLFIVPP